MYGDVNRDSRPGRQAHGRREWSRLEDDRHVADAGERERGGWKVQRAEGALRREAAQQIRELRSRY